jgi:hypothetical protein
LTQSDGVRTAGPGGDSVAKQAIGPLGPKGRLQGEAMAGGRALLVRADHRDLVTAAGGLGGQGLDAGGEHPVVVADQDPQRGHRGSTGTGVSLNGRGWLR